MRVLIQMIKAVQNNLCAFSSVVAADERSTGSPQSIQSSAEDDDCVYVSPDESEKGKLCIDFLNLKKKQTKI